MHFALRDRTDIFIMALAPWVIAIAPAGVKPRMDLQADGALDDPALPDYRICESSAIENFPRV